MQNCVNIIVAIYRVLICQTKCFTCVTISVNVKKKTHELQVIITPNLEIRKQCLQPLGNFPRTESLVELGFESCHSRPTNLVASIEARPEMAVLTKRKVLTEAVS